MNKIKIFQNAGRLGNSLFRYITAIKICIENDNCEFLPSEDNSGFEIKEGNIKKLNIFFKKINPLMIRDYFQHSVPEDIRLEMINYMKNHPSHYVLTDGNPPGRNIGYHYSIQKYWIKDLINNPVNFDKFYDYVFHLRLEDYITLGWVMKVENVLNIIDKVIKKECFDIEKSCIVIAPIKTEEEKNYIETIQKFFINKLGKEIKIESNSVEEDFCIMRNCKNLICSLSTLSWTAAILSENMNQCYFPEWKMNMPGFGHGSVTIRKPIPNTESYQI